MNRTMLAALLALLALAGPIAAAADEGADLFKAKCAACHGPDGKGESPMGKALKVKSLVGTKLSAAEIEKIVAEGRPGTKMVAIKGLTPAQIKAVAAHARTLK